MKCTNNRTTSNELTPPMSLNFCSFNATEKNSQQQHLHLSKKTKVPGTYSEKMNVHLSFSSVLAVALWVIA